MQRHCNSRKSRLISASVAAVLTALSLVSCGNSKSEFDKVISETIVEGEFFYDSPGPEPSAADDVSASAPEPADVQKSVEKTVVRNIDRTPMLNRRIRINGIGPLREVFNDSNHRQLVYARRLGITPITSVRGLYRTRRPLVKVTSNRYYTIDTLKHSFPYLVPEAAALLKTIGANFIDSLASRGADGYKIIATSLLRTPMSVRKLRRVNVNATDSSTHQYGTTFDLTYRRFDCADSTRTVSTEDLKNLLAEVLNDLRNEGRCQVKFERKTACYHVTATR